jgi:hypothetical protein
VVNRCIDCVLRLQDAGTGYMGANDGRMYAHTIATLFLCEVSGMVDEQRQARLDAAIPPATRLILSAQQVKKAPGLAGGWRYGPKDASSDLSCSGWALLALRSARLNGVPVPDEAIAAAVDYITARNNPKTGGFGYQDQTTHAITLTGAALLCLELTGHHGKDITRGAGRFLARHFSQLPRQARSEYGLYYTSQGLFQLGGKTWDQFAAWMYDTWLPRQQADGSWRGQPECPAYYTAMTVLAFTVPYRQLPIYQRDESVASRGE